MIQSLQDLINRRQENSPRKLNTNYSSIEFQQLKKEVDALPGNVDMALELCKHNITESPKGSGNYCGTIRGNANGHINDCRYRIELVIVEANNTVFKAYYRGWVNNLNQVYVRELTSTWDAKLPKKGKNADIF